MRKLQPFYFASPGIRDPLILLRRFFLPIFFLFFITSAGLSIPTWGQAQPVNPEGSAKSPSGAGAGLHPIEPMLEPTLESELSDAGTTQASIDSGGMPLTEDREQAFVTDLKGLKKNRFEDFLSPLKRRWFERTKILETAGREPADQLLPVMMSAKLDYALSDIPPLSLSLVRESRTALEAGDFARAFFLAEYGVQFSPNVSFPYFWMGQVAFTKSVLAVQDYLPYFARGLWIQLFGKFQIIRNLAHVHVFLIFAIIACAWAALLIVLIRKIAALGHALRHLLIIPLPNRLAQVLMLGIFSLPIVFKFGFGLIAFTWALLLLPFVRSWERVVVLGAALVMLTLPLWIWNFPGWVTIRSEPHYPLVTAMENQINERDLKRLQEQVPFWQDPGPGHFALGYVLKKRGDYPLSAFHYQEALKAGYRADLVLSNLGNVFFAQGDLNQAIEYYKKALQVNPGLFYAHYNLGQAYYETKDVRLGTESLDAANKANASLLRYYSGIKTTNFNRLLADAPIPRWDLYRYLVKESPLKQSLSSLEFQRALAPIPPTVNRGIFVLLSGLALVIVLLGQWVRFPQNCAKCNEPACQWCYFTPKREDLCSQCFNAFVKKEGVDQMARNEKELEIAGFENRRRKIARFLTVVFPGSGHSFLGYAVTGVCMMVVTCGLAYTAIVSQIFFPAPVDLGFSWMAIKWSFLLLVGGFFMFLALQHIYSE